MKHHWGRAARSEGARLADGRAPRRTRGADRRVGRRHDDHSGGDGAGVEVVDRCEAYRRHGSLSRIAPAVHRVRAATCGHGGRSRAPGARWRCGSHPAGHDAWVVGDEPCEIVDFSRTYAQLIDAGEAYHAMTAPRASGKRCSRSEAAQRLRSEARAGRLDPGAVALVLGAVGSRPGRRSGPGGLTAREMEVLVLMRPARQRSRFPSSSASHRRPRRPTSNGSTGSAESRVVQMPHASPSHMVS